MFIVRQKFSKCLLYLKVIDWSFDLTRNAIWMHHINYCFVYSLLIGWFLCWEKLYRVIRGWTLFTRDLNSTQFYPDWNLILQESLAKLNEIIQLLEVNYHLHVSKTEILQILQKQLGLLSKSYLYMRSHNWLFDLPFYCWESFYLWFSHLEEDIC